MKISTMIEELQRVQNITGDVEVVLKESSGFYNTRLRVGWHYDHLIDEEGNGSVAIITSYVM